MKRKKLFTHILKPVVIILLLLPPLTCTIFFYAAREYAYQEAVENLRSFQKAVVPLMEKELTDSSILQENVGLYHNSKYISSYNLSDREKTFLYQVSPIAARMGGYSQVIILNSNRKVVYPRDESTRVEVTPLANEFSTYIESKDYIADGETEKFTTINSGDEYLISVYKVPNKSMHIKYIIAYCPMFRIGSWVKNASILVLIISSIFVLIIITILWISTHSIIHPLKELCQGAERIGKNNFSKIESEFSIYELEELRMVMNKMSEQLMQSEKVQKNFFQNVSHELRNPLMSISGYAQGIEQGIFVKPQNAAHTILEESMRLTSVVNSLLDLSHLESEQANIIMSNVFIFDVIEDCFDRLNGLAIQNGIKLKIETLEKGIKVWASEDLIDKILDNLITNAIRYAKTTIMVCVEKNQNSILISVSDDGNGIAEKDMPHVFERCYKGEKGNFGLGLAIARSAALKMDGELSVVNLKNGGAKFTLCLKNMITKSE